MSPDARQHRGAHPADRELFAPGCLASLCQATGELSWLLGHGYAMPSSLKLVGDRHCLTRRQRLAVSRAACSDSQREKRRASLVEIAAIKDEPLVIDGFNLIITVEAALAGGALVLGRDGCIRDLSGVHGSYRSVQETESAVCLIGEVLQELGAGSARWLLDKPISNSGRLAGRIDDIAARRRWPWSVEVVMNPDKELLAIDQIAVTSDSALLDGLARWVNLGCHVIKGRIPHSWVIDLRSAGPVQSSP